MSKETISRIADKVLEEMNGWTVRPLDVSYAAIGVTLGGERDVLPIVGRHR